MARAVSAEPAAQARLTESDLRARQEADTARVAEVLSIPAGFAAVLLCHFKWRVGRVQEEWFIDEPRVRGAVGLPVPAEDGVELVPSARSPRAYVCGIYYDLYPAGRTRSAGCGHYYCDACWAGYVAAAVGDGPRCLAMQCPDLSCSVPIIRELADAVAAGAKDKARYARFWLRSCGYRRRGHAAAGAAMRGDAGECAADVADECADASAAGGGQAARGRKKRPVSSLW